MILRQLDLTTALRPSLLPDEILLFVQDTVGLYRDKYKIEGHQNGHAYLTSHRICYVDNEQPRRNSVAVELKDVDRPELYAGFLKSSPKITLYPKVTKRQSLAIRSPSHQAYSASAHGSLAPSPTRAGFISASSSPAPRPREVNATWICPICSFSNPVPSNFDPGLANETTPIPPCLACGIKPPLVHVTRAAIAALSNRPSGSASAVLSHRRGDSASSIGPSPLPPPPPVSSAFIECPRCTFRNHPSLQTCEICSASLPAPPPRPRQVDTLTSTQSNIRPESPAPFTSGAPPDMADSSLEVVKLSFRHGGEKIFYDRLKDALIQRKWLLAAAPAVPSQPTPNHNSSSPGPSTPAPPHRRAIGIAGLESRDLQLRKENELVMGNAFSDLEALMTSAKEVIAMAERFSASQAPGTDSSALLSASVSALGLTTTRDMLSGPSTSTSSSSERTYLTQLARDLAELLTDDRTGLLRREGGVMTLIDLWAVVNRRRNGIELVSPRDMASAAALWDELRLPVRLRTFRRSGVMVVQDAGRSEEKTCAAIRDWLRGFREVPPDLLLANASVSQGPLGLEISADDSAGQDTDTGVDWRRFGRGIGPADAAARFGWSLGVAAEELDMAEERGVLVRDQDGVRGVLYWENYLVDITLPEAVGADAEVAAGVGARPALTV